MMLLSRNDAKLLGVKQYFTGKPCVKGHVALRRTNNGECCECQSEQKRAKYLANRDAAVARSREWREKNQDKVKSMTKRYYEKNRETLILKSRRDYLERVSSDAEFSRNTYRKRISYFKKYYQDNRVLVLKKSQAYRKLNPHLSAATLAKRRATKRFATPAWVNHSEIVAVYKERVEIQELFGEPFEVDHIIPLQGEVVVGLHVPWNLRVISRKENRVKQNKFDQKHARAIIVDRP